MSNRRYFVNLQTGGHMILDASMGSIRTRRFLDIIGHAGFEEVNRERYRRLQACGRIGEQAIRNQEGNDA